MDEAKTVHREQRDYGAGAPPGYERRHGWKGRNGTWEALAGLTKKVREERFYKETKGREAGRVADRVVVPMRPWKQGRGKGPC